MVGKHIRSARSRHVPVRTCIGCRERATASELLRVVVGIDYQGQPAVLPDADRTAVGRGAHLHPTTECLDLAVRRRAFTRALRVSHALDSVQVRSYLTAQEPPKSNTVRN